MNTNILVLVKHLSEFMRDGTIAFSNCKLEEYQEPEKTYPSYAIELSEIFLVLHEFGKLINHFHNIKVEAIVYKGEVYHRQDLHYISNKQNTNNDFYSMELRKFYLEEDGEYTKISNIKLNFDKMNTIRSLDMFLSKDLVAACTIQIKDNENISILNINEMDLMNELLSFPVSPYIEIFDSLADLLKIEPSK